MKSYWTSTTVQEQGPIHLTGVPFSPGTRVGVAITPIVSGEGEPNQTLTAAKARMRELFATIKGFRAARLLAAPDKARNTETVGELRRAELYESDTR